MTSLPLAGLDETGVRDMVMTLDAPLTVLLRVIEGLEGPKWSTIAGNVPERLISIISPEPSRVAA